jgi:hypothetical protein
MCRFGYLPLGLGEAQADRSVQARSCLAAPYSSIIASDNVQGKGIPCSRKKIPCSAMLRELAYTALKLRTNSRFAHAQGICLQRFEMTAGIGAGRPKEPRIRKNSLLNSLFYLREFKDRGRSFATLPANSIGAC